jgi:hypothetical protein
MLKYIPILANLSSLFWDKGSIFFEVVFDILLRRVNAILLSTEMFRSAESLLITNDGMSVTQ